MPSLPRRTANDNDIKRCLCHQVVGTTCTEPLIILGSSRERAYMVADAWNRLTVPGIAFASRQHRFGKYPSIAIGPCRCCVGASNLTHGRLESLRLLACFFLLPYQSRHVIHVAGMRRPVPRLRISFQRLLEQCRTAAA